MEAGRQVMELFETESALQLNKITKMIKGTDIFLLGIRETLYLMLKSIDRCIKFPVQSVSRFLI